MGKEAFLKLKLEFEEKFKETYGENFVEFKKLWSKRPHGHRGRRKGERKGPKHGNHRKSEQEKLE